MFMDNDRKHVIAETGAGQHGTEGIIPALESSHAISYASKIAKNYSKDKIVIINLSGRGDKDLETVRNS